MGRQQISQVAGMVSQRSGGGVLSQEQFQEICVECQRRYGEHPLRLHLQNISRTQPSSQPQQEGAVDQGQLAILVSFYRKYDHGKTADDVRQLLARRQLPNMVGLSAEDFDVLCNKLACKYGEHPKAVYAAVQGTSSVQPILARDELSVKRTIGAESDSTFGK